MRIQSLIRSVALLAATPSAKVKDKAAVVAAVGAEAAVVEVAVVADADAPSAENSIRIHRLYR